MTPDDVMAPYFTAAQTDQSVRILMRDYHEYITSVDRHNAVGDEWAAVSLLALIPMAVQYVVWSRVFGGHACTDCLLFDAFERTVGITGDNRAFNVEKIAVDIRRIIKIGQDPCARSHAMLVAEALYEYIT